MPSVGPETARRYPRPMWFRIMRAALRVWWVAFALYAVDALTNLVTLIAHHGFGILWDPRSIEGALLLDQLLPLLVRSPALVASAALVLPFLILLGRLAHQDQRRELRSLEQHRQRAADARAMQQTAERAVHERLKHLEVVSSAPLGPPFDERSLPMPNPFVGRALDLAWLMGRLSSSGPATIIGLTGMGGIGKTSLAAKAVRQVQADGRFPNGIAVVYCQGLTDPVDVLRHLLARFDPYRRAPEAGDHQSLANAAQRLLRGKQALVVLDGVEPGLPLHRVVSVLPSTGPVLLVTARQALPPDIVSADTCRAIGLLAPEEALAVFAYAGATSPDALSHTDYLAAMRIVAALDRHTLALKLAGAFAHHERHDLSALADELEDPRRAMAIPMEETPRAVALMFARSTELLPADARRLFSGLAAFATPECGRRAVLELGRQLGLEQPDESLRELIARALVEASKDSSLPENSDRERVRLHPLTYAFAAELLARWPAEDSWAAQHAIADFYADYTNQAPDRALQADERNIAGAVEWAYAHAQDATLRDLCLGMAHFWRDRWRTTESLHYLPPSVQAAERLAQTTDLHADWARLAVLLLTQGEILQNVGRPDEAEPILRQALSLAHQLGERRTEGMALSALGALQVRRGRFPDAERYVHRSLAIRREVQDRQGEGADLSWLGYIAQSRGRPEEAERYLQRSLAIRREVQDRQGEGTDLGYLGLVALRRGRLAEAERYLQQSVSITRDVQDRQSEGMDLSLLGEVALRRGQPHDAEPYFVQALAIDREVQDRQGEGVDLSYLGIVAEWHGQLAEAEQYYLQSLAIAREVQDRQSEGMYHLYLGRLALARHRLGQAANALQQALTIAREVRNRRSEGLALFHLGLVALRRGHLAEAQRCLREAHIAAHETQDQRSEGGALSYLGWLAQQRGHLEEAGSYLQQSLALLHEARDEHRVMALCHLASLADMRGEPDCAEALYREGLALAQQIERRVVCADMLQTLGQFLVRQRGKAEEGYALLKEAATHYAAMGLPHGQMAQEA